MAKIPFLEILPGCGGMEDMCGGLQNAFVTEIVIDEKRNSMDVSAYFQQAPSASELSAIQGRISGDYGLTSVLIVPSFPHHVLPVPVLPMLFWQQPGSLFPEYRILS